MPWEEYRGAGRLCRDGVRKAMTHLELELEWGENKNKKDFCMHLNQKSRGGCTAPENNTDSLVTVDKEKAELFSNIFSYLQRQQLCTDPLRACFERQRLGRAMSILLQLIFMPHFFPNPFKQDSPSWEGFNKWKLLLPLLDLHYFLWQIWIVFAFWQL